MTRTFFQRLSERAREVDSLLCVGLDPRAAALGQARDECLRLIEATAAATCAFKANSAFFEMHGPEGMSALRDVIAAVPDEIPVILDAKRGDIADTSAAYATAAFDVLGAHAITLSPYLGEEAIAPFLARPEFGAFILCKTSNPGANEFQALDVGGRPLFQVVAERVRLWNKSDNVGLVVGATDLEALAQVRAVAPDLWFLVPGVGAQGGDLTAALAAGLRPDGLGLLINVSRSIARAADSRAEAERVRDEIRRGQEAGGNVKSAGGKTTDYRSQITGYSSLAQALLESGCVRFGQFTLRSGSVSPIYLDLRRLISHPEAMRLAARAYAAKAAGLTFDRVAGIPYAGLPIGTAVALEMNRPLIYARREAKDYGTRASVEGEFTAGETALVLDDLATTGGTKIEAIQKLEEAGLVVRDVVVLIDREQGAGDILASAGYRLHAVVTLRELLNEWRSAGSISSEQFEEVAAYLTSVPDPSP